MKHATGQAKRIARALHLPAFREEQGQGSHDKSLLAADLVKLMLIIFIVIFTALDFFVCYDIHTFSITTKGDLMCFCWKSSFLTIVFRLAEFNILLIISHMVKDIHVFSTVFKSSHSKHHSSRKLGTFGGFFVSKYQEGQIGQKSYKLLLMMYKQHSR